MLADAARLWRAAGPSLATAVADKLIEDEAKAKAPGASAGAGAGAGTAAEAHAEGSLAAGDDDWMSWDGDATGAPRAEASVGGAGRPAGVPPLALGTAPAPQPLLKDPEFATAAAVVSDVQAAASRGGDAIEDREGLPDPSARPPAGKRRAAKALKRKLVQLQQLRALEQTWDSRATVTRAKDNSSLPLNDREYFDAPKPFDESTRAISPRAIDGFVRTEDGNFHLAFYALRNAERAALTERPKPFVRPGTLGRTAPAELRSPRAPAPLVRVGGGGEGRASARSAGGFDQTGASAPGVTGSARDRELAHPSQRGTGVVVALQQATRPRTASSGPASAGRTAARSAGSPFTASSRPAPSPIGGAQESFVIAHARAMARASPRSPPPAALPAFTAASPRSAARVRSLHASQEAGWNTRHAVSPGGRDNAKLHAGARDYFDRPRTIEADGSSRLTPS
ncbi:hypothetical protein FNF29_03040 [Cafeteria roenbergensis]|uniref:Uncharacterized protein n=1 Tax=Cafeteria roenbergensis TaxID=33653 RepID=A0A5A8CKN4_CAFRO|nr:hypothetical protein FNF29_03040 [Cafeteria roenbergensis]|eukprot:KAA0153652.1 hypothetical protein FNF29_03040 [Cafeteria roenbergensis]